MCIGRTKASLRIWYAVGLFALPASAPAQATFQGLGDLSGGAFVSVPYAISADGSTVVGVSFDRDMHPSTAFRWRAATGMISLGRLPHPFDDGTIAYAVSADGSVVVGAALDELNEGYPTAAFMWTEERGLFGIGGIYPGGGGLEGGAARGISDDGAAVAGYSELTFGFARPSRWSQETNWERLDDWPQDGLIGWGQAMATTPDGAVLAGWIFDDPRGDIEAFVWREKSGYLIIGDLPGGTTFASANGISADGSVVVGESNSANNSTELDVEAFRWTAEAGMVGLGDLPGGVFRSRARAVSRDGSIILGSSSTSLPGRGAMIWDEKHGIRQLYRVLVDDYGLDLTGWQLESAIAISANNQTIVGVGFNSSGSQEGWIAHLPPPICRPDFNADSTLNSQDFFDYLIAFFAGDMTADFNRDKLLNSQDFFDFLAAFFTGC